MATESSVDVSPHYVNVGSFYVTGVGLPVGLRPAELAFIECFRGICLEVDRLHAIQHRQTKIVLSTTCETLETALEIVVHHGVYSNASKTKNRLKLKDASEHLRSFVDALPESNDALDSCGLYPPGWDSSGSPPLTNASYVADDGCVITWSESGKVGMLAHLILELIAIAKSDPEAFGAQTVAALTHFYDWLTTGVYSCWLDYMEDWTLCNDRVDWIIGPIETYHDPTGNIGEWGAQVGVQTTDMSTWTPYLAKFEAALPYDAEHRRDLDSAAPFRVFTERVLAAGGGNGPRVCLAAFCLPNEDELRANASKQVIHTEVPSLLPAETLRRYMHPVMAALDAAHPNLFGQLWETSVILHETVGHGAGKLADGTTSADVIAAFGSNYGYMEELRAEVAALYMCLHNTEDVIKVSNIEWDDDPDELRKIMIQWWCGTALRRAGRQPKDATTITGAHARADITIANWLAARNIVVLNEALSATGSPEYFFELKTSTGAAATAIAELCLLTNLCKSTCDVGRFTMDIEVYLYDAAGINGANLPEISSRYRNNMEAKFGTEMPSRVVIPVDDELDGYRAPDLEELVNFVEMR